MTIMMMMIIMTVVDDYYDDDDDNDHYDHDDFSYLCLNTYSKPSHTVPIREIESRMLL